jgi:type II secretory pathway pseudopilin PulG
MRSGDVCRRRGPQRGFTYLLLIFLLAVAGAGLAALGQQWAVAGQREREAELRFRGAELGRALALWRDATPPGQADAPQSLQELLVDTRHQPPRHHLRRLYTDPFTGRADWDLLTNPQGRIVAVASRSRQLALRRVPALPLRPGSSESAPAVGDWLFEAPLAPPVATEKKKP